MKNLYTFSRKSWIFKFPDWVYGIDSANTFKTFCPLFWLLVLTILFIWIIIPIKLLGKRGTIFLDKLRRWREIKEQKEIEKFIKKYSHYQYTNKEAYDLVKSKCFKNYKWNLESKYYDHITDKYRKYDDLLYRKNKETKIVREEKVKEFKESRLFNILSIIIISILGLVILYIFYKLWMIYEFLPVDWEKVKLYLQTLGILVIGCVILYLIIFYIIVPLFNKIKCMDCIICKWKIWNYFPVFFVGIARGVVIFFSMIKATYKAYCPIITLKD